MMIKKRKKNYIKRSKNGTIFYVKLAGDKWCDCEPFNVLYIKYNQYLFNRDGEWLRISQMNQNGYEYSAYLYDDLKRNSNDNKDLEDEVIDTYLNMIGKKEC